MNLLQAPRLACAGCGAILAPADPYPFRCPQARDGDDIDHVVTRALDPGIAFPAGAEPHPFVRYRTLLASHARARAAGFGDDAFADWVGALDARIAAVDGHGFAVTPFTRDADLAAAAGLGPDGALWVKDETGQVGGSHKARHLMGVLLHLELAERAGWTTRAATARRGLAIASCGNAALAAATLARATDLPLAVFIPPDANPRVVARLRDLGAAITVCPRDGEPGDPCYRAFRRALAQGAIPFCCQGSDNGLTIEGGSTLVWEIVSALGNGARGLDRLFVQVGGGALASACVQGLREARDRGALAALPRVHAVQTRGAFPLRRAYDRLRARILRGLGADAPSGPTSAAEDEALADRLRAPEAAAAAREALRHARTHRSAYMWPWETAPASIAHGILDDETYDGFALLEGMIESGGWPVTAGEDTLADARDRACATGRRVDATGAAGLAGLLELRASGLPPAGATVAVLFTGGAD